MIVFAVELSQFRFKVVTDPGQDTSQIDEYLFGKYFSTWKWRTCFPRESEFALLKESPSQSLQHALKNLGRAFVNFFEKRTEYPRFKKRGFGDSFRFPQGFKLDQANDRVLLPKLGWLRYCNSREVVGTVLPFL